MSFRVSLVHFGGGGPQVIVGSLRGIVPGILGHHISGSMQRPVAGIAQLCGAGFSGSPGLHPVILRE